MMQSRKMSTLFPAAAEPRDTGLSCCALSEDLLKAHGDVAERTGLLPLQPLIDASQMEVVPALGPDLWIVCGVQPESELLHTRCT